MKKKRLNFVPWEQSSATGKKLLLLSLLCTFDPSLRITCSMFFDSDSVISL